jgi:hypothetical protein
VSIGFEIVIVGFVVFLLQLAGFAGELAERLFHWQTQFVGLVQLAGFAVLPVEDWFWSYCSYRPFYLSPPHALW